MRAPPGSPASPAGGHAVLRHIVLGAGDTRRVCGGVCAAGLGLPALLVVADSWFSDSKLMQHIGTMHQVTLLVKGKQSYVFILAMGDMSKDKICRVSAFGLPC